MVWLFKHLALAYGTYLLAFLALDLSYAWLAYPLASFLRYASVLFPVFMFLGATIKGRAARLTLVGQAMVLAVLSYGLGTVAGPDEGPLPAPDGRLVRRFDAQARPPSLQSATLALTRERRWS